MQASSTCLANLGMQRHHHALYILFHWHGLRSDHIIHKHLSQTIQHPTQSIQPSQAWSWKFHISNHAKKKTGHSVLHSSKTIWTWEQKYAWQPTPPPCYICMNLSLNTNPVHPNVSTLHPLYIPSISSNKTKRNHQHTVQEHITNIHQRTSTPASFTSVPSFDPVATRRQHQALATPRLPARCLPWNDVEWHRILREKMLFKHDLEVMLIHKFSNFVDSWKNEYIYIYIYH